MTRVKICGLTNLDDARAAAAAGADLLGFIFYPGSPRYVTSATVRKVVDPLKNEFPNLPKFVGVFVNASADEISHTLHTASLDYAQLHGDEPPALLETLAPRAFKALRPTGADEARADAEWFGGFGPHDGPQLLLDAYDPHHYGGTGAKADWHVAAGLARIYPRLLLAGGLTPANVDRAVAMVKPWGVDVSSGVEQSPGRKDHGAISAFVAAAKGVTA